MCCPLLEIQQTSYGMNVQLENLKGRSYWGKRDVSYGSQVSVVQVCLNAALNIFLHYVNSFWRWYFANVIVPALDNASCSRCALCIYLNFSFVAFSFSKFPYVQFSFKWQISIPSYVIYFSYSYSDLKFYSIILCWCFPSPITGYCWNVVWSHL